MSLGMFIPAGSSQRCPGCLLWDNRPSVLRELWDMQQGKTGREGFQMKMMFIICFFGVAWWLFIVGKKGLGTEAESPAPP